MKLIKINYGVGMPDAGGGSELGTAALGIGTGLISGAASGLIGAGIQAFTQDTLNAQNFKYQQKLADLQEQHQYDLWQKTGPVGMMQQYAKAGLNPALMYGDSGAGGQLGAGLPSNSAPQAQDRSGMGIQGMQAAMQLSLLKAQKENIEADTANKEANTQKTTTADIPKTQAETQNVLQQYDNLRQDYEYKRLQNAQATMQNWITEKTMDLTVEQAKQNLQEQISANKSLAVKANVDQATQQTQIDQLKAELVGTYLANKLLKSQTNLTDQELLNKQREIINDTSRVMQGWDSLSNDMQRTHLQEIITNYSTDPVNKATQDLSGLLQEVLILRNLGGTPPAGGAPGEIHPASRPGGRNGHR